jgi:DNA processing protein
MRTMTPEELLGPLNDIEEKFAPPVLFVSGRPELIQRRSRVAIVGSRDASKEGLVIAEALASQLVERGVQVVSGLARGIDTAAHRGAIEAGGFTIAVLGTPLDEYAIKPNKWLQELIAKDHLAISQFASGSRIYPGNFPTRNRTMALVCHASIIVEAGDSSGTLSQGWEALRLGRPLFLGEKVLQSRFLEWPKKMMDHGAMPLPEDLDDLCAILPNSGEFPFALAC